MLPSSFTEGSKNVRHLPRYLSIQDPLEFEVVVHEGESDTKLARIDSFGSWSRRN
jgi:hypothetical protein